MKRKSPVKTTINILLGLVLILGGVLYGLKLFDIVSFNISLDGWWTLFIIIPCINGLITDREKIGSFLGLTIGILLLLAARDVFSYRVVFELTIPIVIVALGIKLILHSLKDTKKEDQDSEHSTNAIFSGAEVEYNKKIHTETKISAVFGEAKCNMKTAEISNGSCIETVCAFGGIELTIPENVRIENRLFCLFGGINDKRDKDRLTAGDVTVIIEGVCIFGGIEIK